MNATQQLALYGVTLEQARDFMVANLDNPELIYVTAWDFELNCDMLAEIYGQGVSAQEVADFFHVQGLDGRNLTEREPAICDLSKGNIYEWSIIGVTISNLSALYRPLETDGVLSASALTARILEQVPQERFDGFMGSDDMDFNQDGIVTADEARAPDMPSFEATVANGAAHNYGLLIRMLTAVDATELQTLEGLLQGYEREKTPDNLQNYMDTMVQAMLTPANPPVLSNDEVATIVVTGLVSAMSEQSNVATMFLSSIAQTSFD